MLVLTRRRNESISVYAPDGTLLTRITVVEFRKDKVRLGFVADKSVKIFRDELTNDTGIKEERTHAG